MPSSNSKRPWAMFARRSQKPSRRTGAAEKSFPKTSTRYTQRLQQLAQLRLAWSRRYQIATADRENTDHEVWGQLKTFQKETKSVLEELAPGLRTADSKDARSPQLNLERGEESRSGRERPAGSRRIKSASSKSGSMERCASMKRISSTSKRAAAFTKSCWMKSAIPSKRSRPRQLRWACGIRPNLFGTASS